MKKTQIVGFIICLSIFIFATYEQDILQPKPQIEKKKAQEKRDRARTKEEKTKRKTLKLASWNIRILSKKRSDKALEMIANIIQEYDFISIVEIRDQIVIDRLCSILQEKGKTYNYELSKAVGNKIKERYCFLYDVKKIRVIHPGKIYEDPEDLFIREPYYATFICENFDFTVISTHIIWGKSVKQRRREIVNMAKVFNHIQDADEKENDVMLLGDFNRPPRDDLSFGALRAIPSMMNVFSEPEKSMVGDTNLYDNIWFQKKYVQEFMNIKGINRFDEVVFQNDRRQASKLVSDHRPIWAVFRVDAPDDD